MDQASRKQQAARAALEFIKPGMTLGVGTGSTVNFFIDELIRYRDDLAAIVASSRATEARLRARGLTVSELEEPGDLDLYVDGADEANKHFHLIKGGGGALTREKILAAASRKFVCIIDQSKWVATLGQFPLPIEVIPMARVLRGPPVPQGAGPAGLAGESRHRQRQSHPRRAQPADQQPGRSSKAVSTRFPDRHRRAVCQPASRRDSAGRRQWRETHGPALTRPGNWTAGKKRARCMRAVWYWLGD